ncbi:MAG: Maf family protein [Firmicutes bacterium]|nr:Maf family protein [Bacillota bacterium]
MKIILASASPRRKEMLERLGISFDIIKTDAPEINVLNGEFDTFHALAMGNARCKVEWAARAIAVDPAYSALSGEPAVLVGADTIVIQQNEILGKPADDNDARRMLRKLSGRIHRVVTGVALLVLPEGRIIEDYEQTSVKFRHLDRDDIENYIKTGEHRDKAGSYGIQHFGVLLVESVRGDYHNVVGLPMLKLYTMLKKLGYDILKDGALRANLV